MRKAAFDAFYAEFSDHRYTLASALASSVKGDAFLAQARNYPSSLEASLFIDDVPVAVYENLITAVRLRLPVLHRYYGLRQRVFNLPDLHVYDTYAPLVSAVQCDVGFDDAADKVLSALTPLGKEYTVPRSEGRTLVRPLRKQGEAERGLLFGHLRGSSLYPDELQVGCFLRHLYTGPRGGPFDAYLVRGADTEFSNLSLSDLPGRGCIDLQRDSPHRASTRRD